MEDSPLTPRTNDYRRVCYDFTFSGPKSFSVIEALAGPEESGRLRHAFDEAVTETLSRDIEPDMHCRVRAKGADHDVITGNVLTVGFDHATAWPEDDDTPCPIRTGISMCSSGMLPSGRMAGSWPGSSSIWCVTSHSTGRRSTRGWPISSKAWVS